jgi:hypothetical protein
MRTRRNRIGTLPVPVVAGGGWSRAEAQDAGEDPCAFPRVNKWQGMISMTCTYNTRYDKLGASASVERGRTPDEMKLYLKTLMGTAKETSGDAMKPVPGLGDQAHWGQIGPTSGMLHVIKGTDVLSIRTYGKGPGAGTLDKTKELMAIVYPRFAKLPPYAAPAEASE